MAHGVNFATAARQTYAIIFGMIERQAAILSFLKVFRLFGFIFLALIPLLLLMRRASGGPSAPMH